MAQAAPPIVFLHGWCGSPAFWQPVVDFLGSRYGVLAPRLPHDGSLPELPERCILAGHSMGATLVRRLLRHRPQGIAAAILIDGHLPKFPPEASRRESFLAPFRTGYEVAASRYIDTLAGPATPGWVKGKMLETEAGAGLRALESLNDADTCAWLGTEEDCVNVPVWALWAEPSPMARVGGEHREWMGRWCPNLRYECWPGASHFLHLDEPGRFTAGLCEFLEEAGI